MILSVQAATELSGGVLEQKILEQTAQMDKYSRMVESIKEENKTVYRDIYSVLLDSQQFKQPVRQLCEFKPETCSPYINQLFDENPPILWSVLQIYQV